MKEIEILKIVKRMREDSIKIIEELLDAKEVKESKTDLQASSRRTLEERVEVLERGLEGTMDFLSKTGKMVLDLGVKVIELEKDIKKKKGGK